MQWRLAFAGDHLCVSLERAVRVGTDNLAASRRVDPVNHAYGPDTCRPGFVWREADRRERGDAFQDRVCVTPDERARVAAENQSPAKSVKKKAIPYNKVQP